MQREQLLDVSAAFNAAYPFEQTFMVSALNGSGVAGPAEGYRGQACRRARGSIRKTRWPTCSSASWPPR